MLSSALWLKSPRYSSPSRNRVTHARDGVKITEESSHISFRRERRPFPLPQRMSFSISYGASRLRSSFDVDRERKAGRITRASRCLFPQHLKGKKPLLLSSSARNGSNVSDLPCHPGETFDSERIPQRFNNQRERIIVPNADGVQN